MVSRLGRNLEDFHGTRGLHYRHFAIDRARSRRGRGVGVNRNDHHSSGDHGSLHWQD